MTNSLPGLGGNPELDAAISELNRLAIQVNNLSAGRDVGNVLGGSIRTEIAPGLLPIGPYRQDVDATFSLEFTLWISEEILRIRKLTLHLTPKPSRLAVGVTASSGVLTSNATGTTVNVPSSAHTHIWLSKVSSTPINSATTVSGIVTSPTGQRTAGTDVQVPGSPHTHLENNVLGGPTSGENTAGPVAGNTHVHPITLAANQSVIVFSNYSKWGTFDSAGSADATRAFDMLAIAGHPNDMYTSAAQGGVAAVPTAAHTHDVPGHTHAITLSISESGMANNLHLYIDGVDYSAALGGPWTAATTIVLDPNLILAVGLVDARLNPVTGPHTIKVTSTASGAIEVVGDYSVIIKGVQ